MLLICDVAIIMMPVWYELYIINRNVWYVKPSQFITHCVSKYNQPKAQFYAIYRCNDAKNQSHLSRKSLNLLTTHNTLWYGAANAQCFIKFLNKFCSLSIFETFELKLTHKLTILKQFLNWLNFGSCQSLVTWFHWLTA